MKTKMLLGILLVFSFISTFAILESFAQSTAQYVPLGESCRQIETWQEALS
jgi:hypothetical protein